ncbi:hypothetical protein PAMA_003825 [Pampus argenteus]
MESFHHLSQHANTRFESPAKVFAKLKSKVTLQREVICEKGIFNGAGRDKHGADFHSPRRRTDSTWMPEELKENHRPAYHRSEAEALTLSPISSPQKNLGYSYSDFSCNPVVEIPHVTDVRHPLQSRNHHTPTKRAFLESTSVFHPQASAFHARTQPGERHCGGWMSEEGCAPLEKLLFSPTRNRKRKWTQQEMKVSSSTKEVCRKERESSYAFTEDDTHNNMCVEDLDPVRGCSVPAERSEMNRITHEAVFARPTSTAVKRCGATVDKLHLMSPAKMFACMKQRENKREQQDVHKVSSSTRDLGVDMGPYCQSSDTPPSTADSTGETEDAASRGVSQSQSDTEPCDVPAPPSQPVLLEDPLVLNSPRISIPKKNKAVFKHNRWSQHTTFPSESVIHLTKWFLRRNRKGLFVDGFCKEGNIPWNSNNIVERVSSSVLKTISGRVYILVGKMHLVEDSEFPKWLLKKFVNGFPPNWKELYEKFLSESRVKPSSETERSREGKSIVAKTTSKGSERSRTVKQYKQKPLKTPDSCPDASSSTKVSRSGRVIKPPLEYWKGGRVILDAHMNVTIYECYDTSICKPEVNTTVCASLQKPVRALCSKGREQYESTSDTEPPVLLRRVKAPTRKRKQTKVKPEEKPPSPAETSSEDNRRRSSQRCLAKKRTHVNTVSPSLSKPEKVLTHKSKKQTHNNTDRRSGSRRTVTSPTEAPAFHDKVSQRHEMSSTDGEFTDKRKKRDKGAQKKKSEKVAAKSKPTRVSPRRRSSEENGKEPRKTARVTKQKQSETSPPVKSLPKSVKKHKVIPQEQDEDEWTEAELMKLQQAVSCFPKHVAGYWAKVASMVGTRSAEECHNQHTSHGNAQTPAKRAKKTKKEKEEAPKEAGRSTAPDCPLISARVGTFKRKQQVRQFLEALPRDDVEDVFSTAYMQSKRFEIPSMCPSEENDVSLSDLEPVTPMSTCLLEAKTPQCLHITPGMMGSPNRNNGDKYVYQLQKRMKKNQFNVHKQASSPKSYTPTPTVKRKMRRCGNTENNSFVVWEMFPDQELDSKEEEDFYFSDND